MHVTIRRNFKYTSPRCQFEEELQEPYQIGDSAPWSLSYREKKKGPSFPLLCTLNPEEWMGKSMAALGRHSVPHEIQTFGHGNL